jgi:hypothetical protein
MQLSAKLFQRSYWPRGDCCQQPVAADFLVAPRIIDLVKLVAAAELGADRIL